MGSSTSTPKVRVSTNPDRDEFWESFAKSLISDSLNVLDSRAQFMIATVSGLLVADFAVLRVVVNKEILAVTPQFLFAISILAFIVSLYPRHYRVNPWIPAETETTYNAIISTKHQWHIVGFILLFAGLALVALTSLPLLIGT